MARKKSPTLTEAEVRLMEVLWEREEATVGDVLEALQSPQGPAYTTVLTTMRILEKKGYIRHRKQGRAFLYQPVVDRESARRSVVKYMVSRFFEGSPELLVLNLLENEQLDADEMARLKEMIAERE